MSLADLSVADMQALVYDMVDEPATANDRCTPAAILDALNLAYMRISKASNLFTRDYTFSTVPSQARYAWPDDGYGVRFAAYGQQAIPLIVTDTQMLDTFEPGWRAAAAGTPAYFYRYDERQFGLYPKPAEAASVYTDLQITPSAVVATGAVPLLTLTTDKPLIRPMYRTLLVRGAAKYLLETVLCMKPNAGSLLNVIVSNYDAEIAGVGG